MSRTVTQMRSLILAVLLCAGCIASPVSAQVAADDSITAFLRQNGIRLESPAVLLWIETGALSPDQSRVFLNDLSHGIDRIGGLLGVSLDTVHYGQSRVEVFVAGDLGISHVYGSYRHMSYNRPYLYLDAEKVVSGEAPYLHELTHLLAWSFGSHSLREGLASYIESVIRAEAESTGSALFGAISPAVADQQAAAKLTHPGASEVLPWIGKSGFAPAGVTSPERPRIRALYYTLSQSFAQYLISRLGLEPFMAVYASPNPEEKLLQTTGMSLEDWKQMWQAALHTSTSGLIPAKVLPSRGSVDE